MLHDKWTLERLIGVGGMGAVYAARHRNGARAAVKVLSASSGRLPHIRDRFLREGYAANRVEHPGVVKVLDDDVINEGDDEGTAYLVMELLEGESLQQRAKREPPLTERDLLEIADGVLAVLEAAHAKGVVHRDLKPDNLFLARDPERGGVHIKVLDFGLARLLETQEKTIAGMALGTPTYMSPEQAAGHVDEIDGRTDIYALGCILFQLLSNRRVHDAAHTLGLVVRMATTPAPKLATVAPEVSEDVARIVDRALEFKREDRYPNATAMRADVKAALARRAADASTVHILPASSPVPDPPAAVVAPTVAADAPQAAEPQPARSVAEDPDTDRPARDEEIEKAEPAPREGRWTRTVAVFGVAAVAWLLAWSNWSSIERVVFSSASPREEERELAIDAESASEGDSNLDAAVDLDAAAIALAAAEEDLDEDDDPDASDVDAGDDDDDDDDDDEEEEELDAGVGDAAVATAAATSRPSAGSPPRKVKRPPTAKPTKKKPKPQRRPGQPRRKKKKPWRR